ncbi:ABC transporter ATP-binding protein [Paenibacillus rigui]|uniref:Multidrug ABC transporter ATP-binding protein n=1 Tax=Paenibacillus rigui TaxID=554312 RepID=A0A229UI55_9BACL|nr:ABC transporter ATP-binding protein [Paenibacillus rigui]OXM82975.1 multidrug ABC transporter ATP-binding protein [Paenibacillus rigui]
MKKLFAFLKPYRLPIGFVLALVFLQSLSDLYLPTLMSDIVDHGIVQGDTSYIFKIGGFMLLVAAAGGLCSIAASYFSAKVAAGFGKLLRGKVFTHVENFSLQEFDKLGTASLITRTTNDITQVQQVLTMMMRMMVSAPMMCIGGIIMAVSKDAKLSLVIVAVIPVLAAAIFLIARQGMPLFKAQQKKLDHLNLVLREGLTGIRVIRSFNRIEHEQTRFRAANRDLTDTATKVNRIMAAMMPVMMLVMNLASVAIVWFGGIRIDGGHMQVGDLMAFLQYAMQIMFSLIMVSMMFVMIPRASVSAARINEVLDMVPDMKDGDRAHAEQAQLHKGYVEFQDVAFSYPGAEKPALSGISFHARPGETTAIIGGTGSGKTTLISLIPRFYDVDQGRILVDGVDVRELPQADLRSKIGFVPQKAVLFTGTIADNIRYGKEGATMDEIKHAAETAQASGFIGEMKDGYDSVIAQGGTNVSGGQKQRLSIARALVRRPEIYVFDDSFSALDFKTDALLRAALKRETGEATVLIVAQRVTTVMDADRIIVLEDGEIAGMGTHRELMNICAVYREIVSSQLSETALREAMGAEEADSGNGEGSLSDAGGSAQQTEAGFTLRNSADASEAGFVSRNAKEGTS